MSFRKHIDYDEDMEAQIIGIFLMEPDKYSTVMNILTEDCFYIEAHKTYYKAIDAVYKKGLFVEYINVHSELYGDGVTTIKGESIPYLTKILTSRICSSGSLTYWCIKLRELAAKRLLTMLKNSGAANGDIFEEAAIIEAKLKDIFDVRVTDDWVHISQAVVKLSNHMDSVQGDKFIGVSTTVNELDMLNGGIRPGQLVVIGARPGVGKSAFMGRIAVRAAAAGKHVGIISLEMEDKDIVARSLSAESDIPFWRIDTNKFDRRDEDAQRSKCYSIMGDLAALPIHFSDTSQVNIHDIRAKAEKLKARKQLDLLIIDYLQLIESESTAKMVIREQEVAKISRGLKLLAMNLQIPVIILAQLNRGSEANKDKKPELHNLRESGAIEQDADIVFFLHRDWKSGIKQNENGESTEFEADLLCRKWRNGKEVDTKLKFNGDTMKFEEFNKNDFPAPTAQLPKSNFQPPSNNSNPNNINWDEPTF